MRKAPVLLLVIFSLLFASPSPAGVQADPMKANAKLVDAQGESVGTAELTESPGGVRIRLELSRLPPGVHAFHIHSVDRCDPPDFKSAGPHFNPHGKEHGMKNPKGAHAGDLPNLVVGPDGALSMEILAAGVTLGEGPTSLFDADGSSLVIHADPDDNQTDPAGNAGARIACGGLAR